MASRGDQISVTECLRGAKATFVLRVTGRRRFAVRLWLAGWLLRVAGWVIGFGEVEVRCEQWPAE